MSATISILLSLGAGILAAVLEGVCAGKNVKSFFETLRFPRYSAPLWAWSIIGAIYYVIFCFVVYRLLRLFGGSSALRIVALVLIFVMMFLNALTNYIIFRAQNLRLSFIVGALFPLMDIALFVCLVQLDMVAAWSLIPYLMYRIYAVWWGYGLWRLNSGNEHQHRL